jgi:hypothetical protein
MLRARMSSEYIKYIEGCQKRWVRPDPDTKFAENCIDKLDALNIANSAGFYDENGRAWTLSKRNIRCGHVEIFVKCVEPEGLNGGKNVVKFAWIYPASQILSEDNDLDNDKAVPVSIGDWVVQVAF